MRVLGICGSLRKASYNHRLLKTAAAEVPSTVELIVFDGLAGVPPFNEDSGGSAAVDALRAEIQRSDAVLIATPEYNASIPGHLKNALDWVSTPFESNALRGKPVAVIGASTGLFGAVWAQAELRKVLKTVGARVLETEVAVAEAHVAFDESGRLRKGDHQAELVRLLDELIATACTQQVGSCRLAS